MLTIYKYWNMCAKSKIFAKGQRLEIWVNVAGNGRGGREGVLRVCWHLKGGRWALLPCKRFRSGPKLWGS